MSGTEKRTISLPAEHSAFIDAKVAAGDYASASEVVRAGLRALQERDAAVERWLREEVAPVYDKVTANPSRGIEVEKVFDAIRARHAQDAIGNGSSIGPIHSKLVVKFRRILEAEA